MTAYSPQIRQAPVDLGNAGSVSAEFVPTGVTQDPRPPHEIYISGYVPVEGSVVHATSSIHVLTADGAYSRQLFEVATFDNNSSVGHVGHVGILSDGRLVTSMHVSQGTEVGPGVWVLDAQSNSLVKIIPADLEALSVSVVRQPAKDDVILRAITFGMINLGFEGFPLDSDPLPFRVSPRLFRSDVNGVDMTDRGFVLDSLGMAGEPGKARIDGLDECSLPPKATTLGSNDGRYWSYVSLNPVASSFRLRNNGAFEDMVTLNATELLDVRGAGPEYRTCSTEGPACSPNPPYRFNVTFRAGGLNWPAADPNGVLLENQTIPNRADPSVAVAVPGGFSEWLVTKSVDGVTPPTPLLRRPLLRLGGGTQ